MDREHLRSGSENYSLASDMGCKTHERLLDGYLYQLLSAKFALLKGHTHSVFGIPIDEEQIEKLLLGHVSLPNNLLCAKEKGSSCLTFSQSSIL